MFYPQIKFQCFVFLYIFAQRIELKSNLQWHLFFFFFKTIMGLHTTNGTKVTEISQHRQQQSIIIQQMVILEMGFKVCVRFLESMNMTLLPPSLQTFSFSTLILK